MIIIMININLEITNFDSIQAMVRLAGLLGLIERTFNNYLLLLPSFVRHVKPLVPRFSARENFIVLT